MTDPNAAGQAPNDRARPANPLESLESLQVKVGARADSRMPSDRWAAHEAVLDRLAANIRVAESHGWTSCAIERVDQAPHFNAWGVPPNEFERHPVPDWSTETGSDQQRGDA
ncbi:MAG TPA: hypothetical protein VM076_00790 [Gemmatimonadaceae bacterium]|nr:hypothetical protein [Gemmatimonadaceae bacterium]